MELVPGATMAILLPSRREVTSGHSKCMAMDLMTHNLVHSHRHYRNISLHCEAHHKYFTVEVSMNDDYESVKAYRSFVTNCRRRGQFYLWNIVQAVDEHICLTRNVTLFGFMLVHVTLF